MIGVNIKRIILAEIGIITADITTAAEAKALIDKAISAVGTTAEDVENVHGKTWQINESEASVESYRNDIGGGSIYRRDITPGELTVQFTMGEYSEKMKASIRGGQTITKGGDGADKDTVIGYKGDAASTEIVKSAFCLTQDGTWFIYPKMKIAANTATTDNAAALAVKGYPVKPEDKSIFTEYNFDSAKIA